MRNILFVAALLAGTQFVHAAPACEFESKAVQAAVKEAVADFCDVSSEGDGIDGMFYETKVSCGGKSIPLHLDGKGAVVSVSFGSQHDAGKASCDGGEKQ